MRVWETERDREHLPPSPYDQLRTTLQAQNDNRIQLTSNGFTAHINLSRCRVTNDLTPSVRRMEFLIAHCSMCCDAGAVNGTLLKSAGILSLQNKLAAPICTSSQKTSHSNFNLRVLRKEEKKWHLQIVWQPKNRKCDNSHECFQCDWNSCFSFCFVFFFFFALGVSFLLVEASSDGGEQIKSCLRSEMKA